MEKVILSQRNAHRAATIRCAEHPELGELNFGWRDIRENRTIFHTDFKHKATTQYGQEIVIPDIDKAMAEFEVTSWKYDISLDPLWDEAVRAFNGTSWTPEERAAQYIREFEKTLLADLSLLPAENHEDYITKYTDKVRDLFSRHSRILSAAITGPAKFPASRNAKASESYGRAVTDFEEWRAKYAKRVEKAIEDAKPQGQKDEEEWKRLRADIRSNAETCADIDNGERGLYREAFTTSISGKIERLAKNGREELVNKALDYITKLQSEPSEIGLKKPLFTSRHSIWKLREVAHESVMKSEAAASSEPAEVFFEGCIIRKDFAQDRLMILFDGKPSADMISRLKGQAFRWSPRNSAWQRQLTSNAIYAAARVFYPEPSQSEERDVLRRSIQKA